MVEVRNICKSFGDVRVLDGVNLCLEKGFVYTLKGGNGSGKMPFHLSGGEKQLIAFERLLAHSLKLVLRCEPFAGVNAVNSKVLFSCMTNFKKEDTTFIIVEHKRQLSKYVVSKEIELELETIKLKKGWI